MPGSGVSERASRTAGRSAPNSTGPIPRPDAATSTSPTASSLERLLAEPLASPARHRPVAGPGSSGGSRRQQGSRRPRDGQADKSQSSRSGRRRNAMREPAAGVAAGDCVDHLTKQGLHQGKLAEQDMIGRAGLGVAEGCSDDLVPRRRRPSRSATWRRRAGRAAPGARRCTRRARQSHRTADGDPGRVVDAGQGGYPLAARFPRPAGCETRPGLAFCPRQPRG